MSINTPTIEIVGADANNLRDIDVQFPVGAISMVVGVSGSGKSSLLENTLAREGAERLHTFLGISQQAGKAEGNAFIGRLPPTIHVGQRAFRASSRTTVGTASGILSLLRRMFIRWGEPVSDKTGRVVGRPSATLYAEWLANHHAGKVKVWAIPIDRQATDGVRAVALLRDLGLTDLVIRSETDSAEKWRTGKKVPIAKFKGLNPAIRHHIEVEVAEVDVHHENLEPVLARAFDAGGGRVFVELHGVTDPRLAGLEGSGLDSRKHWIDPDDPHVYAPADEHLLSFNSPEHDASGACPTCHGLGRCTSVDLDALMSAPERSMHEGACSLWTPKNYKYVNIQHETIEGLRGIRGFDPDMPWKKLSSEAKRLVIEGSGGELIVDRERGSGRKMSSPRPFEGFRQAILRRVGGASKAAEQLGFLIGEGSCPACDGTRWAAHARALRLGGVEGPRVSDLLRMDFVSLEAMLAKGGPLRRTLPRAAQGYLDQIQRLAASFIGAGLGHLDGARSLLDVSEGESRRLRLAAVFDGRHQGLCLLLDEPARGLHDQDIERLGATLRTLRGLHTLILNEHRHRLASAADHFVELGPGAGSEGGRVTYSGPVPTAWWKREVRTPRASLPVDKSCKRLRISGIQVNNLSGVDVEIPLGRLVCLTGVSGSGKSSFVRGALVPALANRGTASEEFATRRGRWREVKGSESIRGLVALDQSSPGTNRRSTVATFLGLAEGVRKYFGATNEAKVVGLTVTDFGFNAGTGRCSECQGIGEIEDHGRWMTCPACGGARLGPLARAVQDAFGNLPSLLDRSIADLVRIPHPAVGATDLLNTLVSLGVGHLSLGRRLDTLSGGEVQRLRIGRELSVNAKGGMLFVLDEPAAGLHHEDVQRLIVALDAIVGQGHNSVVVVEHNLDVVKASDWVVEFGPGGGPEGGRVVAAGSPTQIRGTETATGTMLRLHPAPAKVAKSKRAQTEAVDSLPPTVDDATQVTRWLRRLLGDDVPPHPQGDESSLQRPVVILSGSKLAQIGVLEFGGLGRELVALLLDLEPDVDDVADEFVRLWTRHPGASVQIHPLVQEIYVWGCRVPRSVQSARGRILQSLGLDWTEGGDRVQGPRFVVPREATQAERMAVLQDAALVGGGFVELYERNVTLGSWRTRPLDLSRHIVGPMKPGVADFVGFESKGRCSACKGSGMCAEFPTELVFGDRKRPIEDLASLHPQAAAVLKGVHRTVVLPFFKRMAAEEIWPAQKPVAKLDRWESDVLEHGYWHRPGPGSFLKTPKSDPGEVASWLRWDGIHALIRENIKRGSETWQEALTAGMKQTQCPFCAGSGLRAHAELLAVGERSLAAWLRSGTLGELHEALKRLKPTTERARHRLARLLACLAPHAGRKGELATRQLRASLSGGVPLARSVAEAFTDMQVLEIP